MNQNKIYKMSLASIYPLYVAKVQKKGKTISELNEIIKWLTGYTNSEIINAVESRHILHLISTCKFKSQ